MVETSGPWGEVLPRSIDRTPYVVDFIRSETSSGQVLMRIVIESRQNLGRRKTVLETSVRKILKYQGNLVAGGGIEPPTLGL